DPETLAGLGASAALCISDIPFEKPIGTCKVARIDGKLCINPDKEQWEQSDLEIAVSASSNAILMVEGQAGEASEKEVLDAIIHGHEQIKQFCSLVEKMQKEVGKPKRQYETQTPNDTLVDKITKDFSQDARAALQINEKQKRQEAVRLLEKKAAEALEKSPEDFGLTADANFGGKAHDAIDTLLYNMMRNDILSEEKRIAGRKLDQVRPIDTQTNILASPHGSSLFTRGETQVLSTVTLGGSKGDQMVDRITGLSYDKFYLHYTFPPFSVGEARGKFNVSRRELGHGNLAERALKAVLPSSEDFSYTIRVACEVLESNGSSSMGSVCAGSMALMDAGVPLRSPVAGIAMGLVKEGERYKILSDILGDEDHLGDMDFKVAGTKKGITAIQMDIKIDGINQEIIQKALVQAREGRFHILDEMEKTVKTARRELKEGVPRIETFKIAPDKIGALIGPSGKNIKYLQEHYEVVIECEDDGTIRVIGVDKEKIQKCIELASLQVNGPEVGSEYKAIVVSIKEYGAFVDIAPGRSGLLHVSEITDQRVSNVQDYLSEGDECLVKVLGIDNQGRVKFSAKAIKSIPRKESMQ
ncbi:MAG: polyribonucleotide nucleotidyltransferase, partial [Halobacteriovoraceae bacterium]|nr:polyribonucleotide nucleotidyltransferase [Halobacteriovoraceae bacterium]